jgi:cytochrome c-type biogenesis protein CcmE
MRARSTSLLALLLAFAFVAVGVTTAAAKNCDLMAASQEMGEGQAEVEGMVEDQKVEIKGMVEEEKGKTTLEMKEMKPEGIPEEAPAVPEIPE